MKNTTKITITKKDKKDYLYVINNDKLTLVFFSILISCYNAKEMIMNFNQGDNKGALLYLSFLVIFTLYGIHVMKHTVKNETLKNEQ